MAELEYVASGTSYTRILHKSVLSDPVAIDLVNSYLSSINNKNNHKFSLLFNAFTEKSFGNVFKENYAKSLHSIHADSGGLQIITQGKSITPELKDSVYRVQAQDSDIAMCFDEIPVGTVGTRSNRNDTANRFFDADNLEIYARKTGQNIKRQIEVFMEEKSSAKPMIIAQGNCYETYMRWIEYILKEIPSSYHDNIGGIAMGAAALGTGHAEDIQRAAFATKLPFQMKKPYIHILGVGSVRRLLPYIALIKSGYYPNKIHLSYDSTTHTCGPTLGSYYKENTTTFTKYLDKHCHNVFNDINSKYDLESKGIDIVRFHDAITTSSVYYKDDNSNIDAQKLYTYYHCMLSYICSSIQNFTQVINRCIEDDNYFQSICKKNGYETEMQILMQQKNVDDIVHWLSVATKSSLKSNKIVSKSNMAATLFGDEDELETVD